MFEMFVGSNGCTPLPDEPDTAPMFPEGKLFTADNRVESNGKKNNNRSVETLQD